MSKIVDFFKSHHIQLALATGASIIALAYVSKRILPEPMDILVMAFPPFFAVIGEAVVSRRGECWYGAPWVWVLAVLMATVLVIGYHLV